MDRGPERGEGIAVRTREVIAIGPLAGLAAAVVMTLTIWTPSVLLAGIRFFLIGAGPILWVISITTLRQTVTPRSLLGRVSAINIMASGSRPLGLPSVRWWRDSMGRRPVSSWRRSAFSYRSW